MEFQQYLTIKESAYFVTSQILILWTIIDIIIWMTIKYQMSVKNKPGMGIIEMVEFNWLAR